MLERSYGRIVNIASLTSFVAFHEVAAYAASKAGVSSLTRSLAVEWSKHGVTVNANCSRRFPNGPECHSARQHPTRPGIADAHTHGTLGKTEELVGAAIYLASDASSFVTGQTLVVDGGFLASGVNQ